MQHPTVFQYNFKQHKSPHPLLNFLKGGLITLRLLTTQCLPTLTLAKSPLMMQSFITIVWEEKDTSFLLKSDAPMSMWLPNHTHSQSLCAQMFSSVSSLFHWVQCSGFHIAQTVCSLCCPKPAKKRKKMNNHDIHAFSILTFTEQNTTTNSSNTSNIANNVYVQRKILSVLYRAGAKLTITKHYN